MSKWSWLPICGGLLLGCTGADDENTVEPDRWSLAFDVGPDTAMSGVAGSGPDDIYMVGGDETTGSIWHYDGSDWREDTSAPPTDLLVWVHAFGPDDVWIVGDSGAVLRGSVGNWTEVNVGTTEPLWGVWGADPDDVWIVGGDVLSGDPLILRWNGTDFETIALDASENDRKANSLFKVWGIDGRTFALGQRGLLIEWDGTAWRQQAGGSEANDDFVSLWGTSASNIVAVGGRAAARIATFDGSAWTTTAPERIPGLNAVSLGSETEAVIGGISGYVARFDPTSGEAPIAENIVDSGPDVHAIWFDGVDTYYGAAGRFAEPYFGAALVRPPL